MFDTQDIKGKTILLRLDLNVPVDDANNVTDFTRIDRVRPTIDALRKRGAKIVILSHFGRPNGAPDDKYSLKFLAPVLSERWGIPVVFEGVGDIVLKENMRFNPGEEKDDPTFAASLAKLAALPSTTRVYCTHEYTLSNLAFARAAEPDNPERDAYALACEALRARGEPTLPSTMGRERAINPFLRCDRPRVAGSVAKQVGRALHDPVDCLAALRAWKDGF